MIRPRVKPSVVSLRILPSAMTVAAICLGLSSVKMALDNRPTEAMAFLAVAAILDALDGRIARILKATSRMGEEIDSLADAANFIRTVEARQGLRIGCPEEIAWRHGWLTDEELRERAEPLRKSGYGEYLVSLLRG